MNTFIQNRSKESQNKSQTNSCQLIHIDCLARLTGRKEFPNNSYTHFALTSKRPSWRTILKFRRSTERIIDKNSVVYEHKMSYFLFYVIN